MGFCEKFVIFGLALSAICGAALGMGVKIPVFTTKTEGISLMLPKGQINGHTDVARSGRLFYGFAGIPYAQPPLKELRFEPPVPVENWEGVKNVFDYGEACPQIDRLTKNLKGSEDCLFVNVFTPKTNSSTGLSDELLPVIVFIHGGEYSFGSSNAYEPHYFMDFDIVFVTLNYRLASLGFLNTEDGVVRGNMGLKDQVMALRWVQDNIKLFGGDPSRVTLMGQSSGAGSVHYHMLSPMSQGLFHKAISMGGTAVSPYAVQSHPLVYAKRFGNLVKCPVENTSLLVSCLRSLDVDTIMRAHFEDRRGVLREPLATFSPSIEVTHEGAPDTFLTVHPYAVLNSGRQMAVPWLAGVNSEDGLIVSARILNDKAEIGKINKYWDTLAPKYLRYDPARTDITKRIKEFYLSNNATDNSTPTVDFERQFDNFTNLFSDRYTMFPLHESIRIQSEHAPVYAYYYNYRGKVSFTDIIAATSNFPVFAVKKLADLFREKVVGSASKSKELGVCKLDEIPLFFKLDPIAIDEAHQDFNESYALVKLWTSFAQNQMMPTFERSAGNEKEWTPVGPSMESLQYFRFTNNMEEEGMVDEPMKERMDFWDQLKLNPYGY